LNNYHTTEKRGEPINQCEKCNVIITTRMSKISAEKYGHILCPDCIIKAKEEKSSMDGEI